MRKQNVGEAKKTLLGFLGCPGSGLASKEVVCVFRSVMPQPGPWLPDV